MRRCRSVGRGRLGLTRQTQCIHKGIPLTCVQSNFSGAKKCVPPPILRNQQQPFADPICVDGKCQPRCSCGDGIGLQQCPHCPIGTPTPQALPDPMIQITPPPKKRWILQCMVWGMPLQG